ncbi:hypothetical protein QBC37DRAFT_196061 [Rhypophila decipiens]|uniref:DUF4440 domain-containing protein n=1 Tax=Rhypophila decipiens TaxID=261697 RepID=A0AAN6Y3Z2_9PEZI|nr:hypothetical protein QBC37DRAFT_196061 [Rhypophila decipiens]
MPTVLGLTTDTSTKKPTSSAAKMGNDTWVSKNKPMANGERLNTISKRNHAAALEIETLLWRALCDKPEKAKEYMADDCIMLNPLFNHGSNEPVSKQTDPSIEDVLKGNEPYLGFKFMGDPLVVEVDLMAVSLVYKIALFKRTRKNRVAEIKATCMSSWRQTAGADWLLCAQHVAYADDEDSDEEEDDDEE